MRISRPIAATAIASAAALSLVLTGCTSGPTDEGDITLTITTFGTMGIDVNYAAYEAAHPGVTIEATNLENGGAARDDAYAKIAAGPGLSDDVALEVGWLSTIREAPDALADLPA